MTRQNSRLIELVRKSTSVFQVVTSWTHGSPAGLNLQKDQTSLPSLHFYYTSKSILTTLLNRDVRRDGHDTDILALQTAGPFATSSDLTAAKTSLQSAIDAVLAQLAALTTWRRQQLSF